MNILLIILYLFFTVTGLILLKIGGQDFSFFMENGKMNLTLPWKFLLGFISYVCSFFIWTFILQKYDLTFMYPILVGLAYVMVLVAGVVILNEKLTIYNIVGSAVILLGVVLMNIRR